MTEPAPIYSGEAVLLNWHDAKSGRKIVLQLEKYAPGAHPFDGLDGERFAVVVMGPLASTEHTPPKNVAVSSKGRTSDFDSENGGSNPPPASKPKRHWRDMPPSQRAAMMLSDSAFFEYLGKLPSRICCDGSDEQWLLAYCGVERKRDFDTDAGATAILDQIFGDFQTYRVAKGHGQI